MNRGPSPQPGGGGGGGKCFKYVSDGPSCRAAEETIVREKEKEEKRTKKEKHRRLD